MNYENKKLVSELINKFEFINEVRPLKEILIGREEELKLLHESMCKKRMKNALLVGPAGCGKTMIVQQFAKEIEDKYIVLDFSLDALVSGTGYRGDIEKKFLNAMKAINVFNANHEDKKIILFIDEIHTICSAGGTFEDMQNTVGNMIKPFLSSGEIIVIGATTIMEYEKTIKKDLALNRRLLPIRISELSEENVIKILENFAEKKISKTILQEIYDKSLHLLGSNPDKSIEILDRCMAKRDCWKEEINSEMIDRVVSFLQQSESEVSYA